jgi:hypothetical protein
MAGLDLRYPIGALFTVLGLLVGGFGLATIGDTERYARATSVNINLWWGAVMLGFGLILLLLARRASRPAGPRPAAQSPAGRATERREHELGLEKK